MAKAPDQKLQDRRGWRAVVTAVLATAVLALAFDAWYGRQVLVSQRQLAASVLAPYASAVESAVQRRYLRLAGLRTFVRTVRTVAVLEQDFEPYAEGMRVGAPGIRALELVTGGRITHVVPLAGNDGALGYDLFADARPPVVDDVRRAMQTGLLTVTGPIALVQGGQGLIVRQRIGRDEPGYPDLVAMVVDVDAVLADAAQFAPSDHWVYRITDRHGTRVGGSEAGVDNAVTAPVLLPDGDWTVHAAPRAGWAHTVKGAMWPTRLASLALVLATGWLAFVVAGSQRRLRAAVALQTRDLRAANVALQDTVRERERAEALLHERGERLRLALTSGQMGIWDYDARTAVLHLSESALSILGTTDLARDASGGVPLAALPSEVGDAMERAVSLGQSTREIRLEEPIVLPDGESRWIYLAGEMQRHVDGTPLLVGVMMDVTKRRHLEEQLLHSQKLEAVGTLAGGVAHDFNNLLTAILGFAHLSQDQVGQLHEASADVAHRKRLADVRMDLDEIMKAGQRATLLTGQLLAFSRRQVTKPARVDLRTAVQELERMLHRLIEERIRLVMTVGDEPLPVVADSGQLAQVVVNLVVNARDAIEGSGTIHVSTSSITLASDGEGPYRGLDAGRWCIISVADDGSGMSADVAARMFEPFFTTKGVGEGSGLGLSTVYGIVAQSHGHTLVESTPGVGTVIRVALPWRGDAPHRLRTPMAVPPIEAAGQSVLVVEDEEGLRRLVAEILERQGYRVCVAGDGEEALEQLDDVRALPALVLTDMVMPGMSGAALAAALRARGLTMPILFMSGYPAGQDVPTDARSAFIGKPFTPDDLIKKVRRLLD